MQPPLSEAKNVLYFGLISVLKNMTGAEADGKSDEDVLILSTQELEGILLATQRRMGEAE